MLHGIDYLFWTTWILLLAGPPVWDLYENKVRQIFSISINCGIIFICTVTVLTTNSVLEDCPWLLHHTVVFIVGALLWMYICHFILFDENSKPLPTGEYILMMLILYIAVYVLVVVFIIIIDAIKDYIPWR